MDGIAGFANQSSLTELCASRWWAPQKVSTSGQEQAFHGVKYIYRTFVFNKQKKQNYNWGSWIQILGKGAKPGTHFPAGSWLRTSWSQNSPKEPACKNIPKSVLLHQLANYFCWDIASKKLYSKSEMIFQALIQRGEVDWVVWKKRHFSCQHKSMPLDPQLEFRLFAGIQHKVVCLGFFILMQYLKKLLNFLSLRTPRKCDFFHWGMEFFLLW